MLSSAVVHSQHHCIVRVIKLLNKFRLSLALLSLLKTARQKFVPTFVRRANLPAIFYNNRKIFYCQIGKNFLVASESWARMKILPRSNAEQQIAIGKNILASFMCRNFRPKWMRVKCHSLLIDTPLTVASNSFMEHLFEHIRWIDFDVLCFFFYYNFTYHDACFAVFSPPDATLGKGSVKRDWKGEKKCQNHLDFPMICSFSWPPALNWYYSWAILSILFALQVDVRRKKSKAIKVHLKLSEIIKRRSN